MEREFKPKNLWKTSNTKDIETFSQEYSEFIGKAKTERLATREAERILLDHGFTPIGEFSGDWRNASVYTVNRGKSIIALQIRGPLSDGLNLVVSHIDSPRLDLKPQCVVEEEGIAFMRTHYYGGVKKYQWLNLPLELRGVVVKSDGTVVDVNIGSSPQDPVFVVSDLLPHLDKEDEYVSKKFKAEKLNALAGSISLKNEEKKEAVKANVLRIIYEKYGISEEDLVSSDLQFVPALEPKEIGFDKSLLGAYGHDDRVCAYTSLRALVNCDNPARSCGVILFDREEIGSEGDSGAKARFYELFLKKILKAQGFSDTGLAIDELLENTAAISADVCPAFDPLYKDAYDPVNSARVGFGVGIMKYTGSRGKYSTSEAHAEYLAKVRNIFKKNNIGWQIATMGKVDRGGGGTVAKFLSQRGASTVDIGPAILGMHSPFEIVSKADLYETYRAYLAFFKDMR